LVLGQREDLGKRLGRRGDDLGDGVPAGVLEAFASGELASYPCSLHEHTEEGVGWWSTDDGNVVDDVSSRKEGIGPTDKLACLQCVEADETLVPGDKVLAAWSPQSGSVASLSQ
jgi:hypothetical protein